jgi:hypothetical protein
MIDFQSGKLWLVEHLSLGKDALHLYVALGLFLGSVALLGWRADGWKPWLLVLAAAVGGEAMDIRDTLAAGLPVGLGHNWHDIWNMMVWPTAIALLARSGKLNRSSVDGSQKALE